MVAVEERCLEGAADSAASSSSSSSSSGGRAAAAAAAAAAARRRPPQRIKSKRHHVARSSMRSEMFLICISPVPVPDNRLVGTGVISRDRADSLEAESFVERQTRVRGLKDDETVLRLPVGQVLERET